MTSASQPAPARKQFPTVLGLVGWLLLCFAAAALGGLFPPGEWYAQLTKPAWSPPNWIFGPVWTVLYIMMAGAAWRVWRDAGIRDRARPLGLFLLQLALNAAWSPFFFGLKSPALAFAIIVLLWLAILATLRAFWCVNRMSAALLLPYLGWVSFAAALNLALWRLNP